MHESVFAQTQLFVSEHQPALSGIQMIQTILMEFLSKSLQGFHFVVSTCFNINQTLGFLCKVAFARGSVCLKFSFSRTSWEVQNFPVGPIGSFSNCGVGCNYIHTHTHTNTRARAQIRTQHAQPHTRTHATVYAHTHEDAVHMKTHTHIHRYI